MRNAARRKRGGPAFGKAKPGGRGEHGVHQCFEASRRWSDRHHFEGYGCGSGRRCGGGAAWATQAVRGSDQGREGVHGTVSGLAEGRKSLARNRARPAGQAVSVHGQLEPWRRREGRLRRHDAAQPDRRVQAHRQQRAADRQELRIHGRNQCSDRAGRPRRFHRQPSGRNDCGQPGPPGPQDRACGCQRAAPDRHSGRRTVHDRHPHAQLHVRRQEFELRGGAEHAGSIVVRRVRALRQPQGHASAGAHADAAAPQSVPAIHDAARCAQPVPGLHLQLRETRGTHGGTPRRPARRTLPKPDLGFFGGREVHGQDALCEPLASGEKGACIGLVGTQRADCLLDRPHRSGKISQCCP